MHSLVPNWLAIVLPFLDAGFIGALGSIAEIVRYSRAPKHYHCTEDGISCNARQCWIVHAEEIREVQYKTKEIWIIKKGIPAQLFRISPRIDGSEQVEQFLKERGFPEKRSNTFAYCRYETWNRIMCPYDTHRLKVVWH